MLKENSVVLIISPHADDEVIGCGGLIAYCKKKSIRCHVLYITIGESRQIITGSTNYEIRINEVKEVSQYGNFTYSVMYHNSNFIRLDTVPQIEMINGIEDLIEEVQPTVIAIPFRDSYNQDHRATFNACMTALRPTPLQLRHSPITILEYEEPYTWGVGELFHPNTYLNMNGLAGEKLKLMGLHKSQDRNSPFPRSQENLLSLMKIRGAEIGCDLAESYKALRHVII